jgi:hypothetical protein
VKPGITVTGELIVGLAHGSGMCSSNRVGDLNAEEALGEEQLRAKMAVNVAKQVSHVFLVSICGQVCVPLKYRGVNTVTAEGKITWHTELVDACEKMGFTVVGSTTDAFSGVEAFRAAMREHVRATYHHDYLHFPDYVHLIKVGRHSGLLSILSEVSPLFLSWVVCACVCVCVFSGTSKSFEGQIDHRFLR